LAFYIQRCCTDFADLLSEAERLEKIQGSIPLQRFGTVEEVADAVAFLVGNEYANNCVLNIDGGLSARSPANG
jgi:NAD(P)-dependent dehydrogenase (short-subunit alcohol dehydrogenase family)